MGKIDRKKLSSDIVSEYLQSIKYLLMTYHVGGTHQKVCCFECNSVNITCALPTNEDNQLEEMYNLTL